jgi:cytosine/uracil/thiamine/allantoin permease
MFFIAFIFGKMYKKSKVMAVIIATILNGVIMPFIVMPILTVEGVLGIMPILSLASFVNILIASLIYLFIKKYEVIKNEKD